MFPLWMVPEVFRLEDLIKLEIPVQTFISPALFITVGVHIASNYQLTTHQGWTSVLVYYLPTDCIYVTINLFNTVGVHIASKYQLTTNQGGTSVLVYYLPTI